MIYGRVYNDTLNPTAGEERSFLGPRLAVAIIPFAQSKQGVTYYVVRQITRTRSLRNPRAADFLRRRCCVFLSVSPVSIVPSICDSRHTKENIKIYMRNVDRTAIENVLSSRLLGIFSR